MSVLLLALDAVSSVPLDAGDFGRLLPVIGLVAWLEARVLPRVRWVEKSLAAIGKKVGAKLPGEPETAS